MSIRYKYRFRDYMKSPKSIAFAKGRKSMVRKYATRRSNRIALNWASRDASFPRWQQQLFFKAYKYGKYVPPALLTAYLDWQTINKRNKFIFPNNKMVYSSLANYGTGHPYMPGKVATNTKHKSVRKGKVKRARTKKIVQKAVRTSPVVSALNKQIKDLQKKDRRRYGEAYT